MADNVEIRVDDRIAATIASKLREIKGEATKADTAIDRLKATLNIGNSAGLLQAANDAAKFNKAIRDASTTTYSMVGRTSQLADRVRVLADQERRAAAAIERTNASLRQQRGAAAGAAGAINQLYGYLGAIVGIRTFVDAANDAQTLDNKIRTVTSSAAEFTRVQKALYDMAIANRVNVVDLATAFQRFTYAMEDVPQSEVLQFIDVLSKGLVTFGATTGEAASVITQLSQAFNKGKLDGDEFRSVMENFPPLARALTTTLGKSKEELYSLSRAGKLSVETVRNSVISMADQIEAAFARTVPTIGQALSVLQTKFTRFVSENSLAADLLGKAIYWIGENLHIVIPLIIAFGSAWAVVQIASILTGLWGLATAIGAVTIAIIPLIVKITIIVGIMYALAAAIALVTGNWDNFHGWINNTIDQVGKLTGELTDTISKTMGIDQLSAAQNGFGQSMAQSAVEAATLKNEVAGIMGGNTTFELTKAANDATTALKGTTSAAKSTKEEIKLAAGEIASLSGQHSGVYNVAEALKQTANEAARTYTNGQMAVTELKSMSGAASGIYQVNTAVKQLTHSLKNAREEARRVMDEIQRASRTLSDFQSSAKNNPGFIGDPSLPSFTTPGINTGSNSSIQRFATGGSFTVGGAAGIDRNPVSFMATKGEKVTVQTKAQQRAENDNRPVAGVTNIYFTVQANDADSFRRSRRQVAEDFKRITG